MADLEDRSNEGELAGGRASRPQGNPAVKLVWLAAVLAIIVVALVWFRDYLTLEYLAAQEEALRQAKDAHPLLVYTVSFLIYVAVTALSLPGAAALTLACGWFFGFWRGVVFVSFASTTGATLAFLLSRRNRAMSSG